MNFKTILQTKGQCFAHDCNSVIEFKSNFESGCGQLTLIMLVSKRKLLHKYSEG